MVGWSESASALQLGDGDLLEVGDYEIYYNSADDRWEVRNSESKRSNGQINGASYVSGKVGNTAISFDGDDTIEVPLSAFPVPTSEITISVWVKQSSNGGDDSILCTNPEGSSDRINVHLPWGNGTIYWDFGDTGNGGRLSTSYNNSWYGSWNHWVFTSSSSGQEIFRNNTSIASDNTNDAFDATRDTLVLGRFPNASTFEFWNGRMDDLRIYDRALSSSEISDLYNYGVDGSAVPTTDGLVLHYDFEAPENPNRAVDTSTITHVPKNNSSSLFPTDLGDALAGKALADDGNIYDTVQGAENAASGYVFVGPGTFNEAVTINTAGLMIEGCGRDTLIDGGTSGNALTLNASNITVRNLSVKTTGGGGSNKHGITTNSNGTAGFIIDNIVVRDADKKGIRLDEGSDHIISNCTVESSDNWGIETVAPRIIVTNCRTESGAYQGILTNSDDCIVAANVVNNVNDDGIWVAEDDTLVGGNRVHSAGADGIHVGSAPNDTLIYNNRVSDSASSDIFDNGTNTTKDANLTGTAN